MQCKITIRRIVNATSEPPFEHPFMMNDDHDLDREFRTALNLWRQAHPKDRLFDDYVILLDKG